MTGPVLRLLLMRHIALPAGGLIAFVLMSLFLLIGGAGCAKLSGSSGFDSEGYKFPGVGSVHANGDGTYKVIWEAAPAKVPLYGVYLKSGTDADPSGINVDFDFSQPWKRVADNSVTTDNLLLSHNTCFAVRLESTGYVDGNTAVLCTEHEKFVFSGVASLGVLAGGRFALSWAAVPDTEVVYSLYSRNAAAGASYDFAAEPLLKTSETLVETKAFPLSENRCFLVRFRSRLANSDANTQELCSTDDGVADFVGVDTVTSVIAGQVTVSWVKSVNPAVTGYRVYQGGGFQKNVGEAEASANRISLTGFAAGERLEFGVRAYDRLGREDANTKTVSVLVSDAEVAQGDFPGCVSAEGLDTRRIRITVNFPTDASAIKIYRNSILAGTLSAGNVIFIDENLTEGTSYNYTCHAIINGIPTLGSFPVQGTTANVNPPNFAGLGSVTVVAAGQVRLDWPAPGEGSPVAEFRVYMAPGTAAPAINSTNLLTTVGNSQRQAFVASLGDELQYTFVVTACTSTNLCAGQTTSVTSESLPDAGMPTTPGATVVTMVQGKAMITAPWDYSMGGLGKRRVYMRNPGAQSGVTISGFLYELVRSELVPDRYSPPTSLEITGLSANTTYYFVVRDEDTQTPPNVSQNTSVVSVQSGDIAPPAFPGIANLVPGMNVETELQARFTAVAHESSNNPDGPSQYLVYVTDAAFGSSPDDSCGASVPIAKQADASAHTAGQTVALTVLGLTPRRTYSVCVKARDTAGNISVTNTSLTRTTGDTTPPIFDGLQTLAYNNASEKLELRWNAASSSDVRDYRATLWRCGAGQLSQSDCSASADVVNVTSVLSSGVDLLRSTFAPPLASNHKVSIRVVACDNASPNFAASDNCSVSTRVLSVTLPDVDPPPGFSGIVNAEAVPATEGAIRVSWTAPADWSDYRGFKVYTVTADESMTVLRDCACTATGCPEAPLYCDITGLPARRTYTLFVRAYDSAGNYTALPPSPYATSRTAATLDLTAPTFVPSLNASFVSTGTRGVNLTWSSATDNQSAVEPGASLTYKVYRKVGSTFLGLTATTPPTDGTQLVATNSTTYLNGVANLTANTTEYYTVCAFDASGNVRCDVNSVREVAIPRLSAPVFSGLQGLVFGGNGGVNPDTSATLTFLPIEPEAVYPATGATDYPIYALDTDPRVGEPANACTSTDPAPVLRGAILGPTTEPVTQTNFVLSGLTPRRKYSICLKARDSLGNESATTAALTVVTRDVTAPVFSGVQTAEYNGSLQTIDLTWTASASTDLKNYKIKVWKMLGGNPQPPTFVIRDKDDSPIGYQLTKSDFAFASNDEVRIIVNACDDAAPDFSGADNCTNFADATAKIINLPDVDPPAGFTGVTGVADLEPRATGTARVTWAAMGDWSDVRGFKVYDVLANQASPTLLRDCSCTAYGCPNQITSCDVTGLDAGRTYHFYARAYDAAGNESVMENPNPTSNYRAFRTADLQAPSFVSSLQGSYVTTPAAGISLSWNAATDNQYAAEPNTVGYRLYRKQGSTFAATSRATIESEGTQMALVPGDTVRLFLDPTAGLSDGVTYYYTVCAFDREPQATGGNTTCDGAVRSVTVPDITPPTVANLAGSSALLTRAAPSFDLTWSLADNVTPAGSIVVTIRKKSNATSSSDFPATDATIYRTQVGLTSLTAEEGLNDFNGWVTYRIQVGDTADNSRNDYTFAVQSNRAAVPVTIGTPTATIANSSANISYPITYEGAATILGTVDYLAKVSLNTTGTATCSKGVSGTELTSRSVNLSSCTGNGTVGISLAQGTAQDASNNDSSAAGPSATFTVDNTAPNPVITSPVSPAYYKSVSNVAVSGTCETGRAVTIGGSGVQTGDTVACTAGVFSGMVTLVSGDGDKAVTASQTDAAGNTGTSASVTLTLDTTLPVVTVTSPLADAAAQSELTFVGACEGNLPVFFAGTGVLNPPQMGGCNAGSYSFSVSLTAGDGVKAVSVEQIDLAGNVSAPLSVSVRRDQTAPTVSIGNPSAGVSPPVNSGTAVTYILSFADTGGSGVQTVNLAATDISLTTTGGATCNKAVSGSGTSARSVTLTNCTGNGTVAISVAAGKIADRAGNTSLAVGPSAAFNVDNAAPVLTVTSPVADTRFQNSVTLTGGCEGTLAVTVTSTGIENSPRTGTCSSGTYSISLTLSGVDGSKSLSVTSPDAAGNQSLVAHTLIRDTTPPVLAVTAPTAGTVLYSSYVTLALAGTCESGLNVVLEGHVADAQSTVCTAGSFRLNAWNLTAGDGEKTVSVCQTDSAGNKGCGSRVFNLNSAANPVPMVDDDFIYPVGLSHTLTGMCNSGGAYTTAVTCAQALSVDASCVGGALKVNLLFAEGGPRDVTVTVTTSEVAQPANNWSDVVTFKQLFFCPKGYVGVPGKFSDDSDLAGLGNASATAGHADAGFDPTRDFCVMKYPAKVATSNYGGQQPWEPIYDGNKDFITGSGTTIKENYWPESRAHSTPWVNITRDEAIDRCNALNEAYGLCTGSGCYSAFDNAEYGYRLMSNTQWQVIARNLEKTGGNWTSGTHMNGYLFRGHTDDAIGSNTDLHTQTFAGSSQKSLSHPRRDSGSDYFGTGNSSSQGSTASSGWQERRRFVLSSGASIWDMAGNVWQWVSDNRANLGITAEDDAAGMSTAAWLSYLNGGVNRFSETGNLIFGNFGNGGLQLSESINAGQFYGGSAGAVLRGGYWSDGSFRGLFAATLGSGPTLSSRSLGFRCAFPGPSLPLDPLDSGAPTVGSVERRDNWGAALGHNNAVTVGAGGVWHLGWTVSDVEVDDWRIYVQVRRKIADGTAEGDFPTAVDAIYKEDFNLTSLKDETAWVLDEGTGRYTRNDGKFVNYLVTAIDPHGNTDSETFSVQVTQSCPPGFVGVPGGNTTAGLGHVSASVGNVDKQLDPSLAFCIMKYPAKVMSAGTTAAQDAVGGKFEPILNGYGTFTNDYAYADSVTFDGKVKYLPESRPDSTPWVTITRDDSIKACQALQMQYFGTMPDSTTGTGFQLLSNTQWQVAARNLEANSTNWSNNAVGSGVLNRGHTDNASYTGASTNSWNMGSGSLALPGSVSDANSYFGTGNTVTNSWPLLGGQTLAAGDEQKRTFNLSNGAVLWDMAGNVGQWVTGNNASTRTADDMGVSNNLRAAGTWWDYNNGSLTAADLLLFGSAGGYTLTQNAGRVDGSSAGAAPNWCIGLLAIGHWIAGV